MPVTSLDALLSVDTLTGVVRKFADQADNRACSDLFTRFARPLQPAGDAASWDEVNHSRHLAPVTGPDSPHTRVKRLGVGKRTSTMAMVKAYKDVPGSAMFLQRAPGADMADAELAIATEVQDLANLIGNTKEYLAAGALTGKIEVDPGKVPGSEVAFVLDFKVVDGKATAANSWADPATRIRSKELTPLKQAFQDNAGMRAEVVITEPTVDSYLTGNEDVRGLANDGLKLAMLQAGGGQGVNAAWALLGGLSFRFTDGTYKHEGAAGVERYFPKDTLVLLPPEARLSQVLGWAEGKVHVPAGPVFGGAQGAASMIRELRGTYAYAELRTDPIGIRIYAGWYGLPVILNPTAVYRFKVTP